MQAGFRSDNAPIFYRALQLSTLLVFPGAVAFICILLAKPLESAVLWILSAFVIRLLLPRYLLKRLINSRKQKVRWGLAEALDLIVITVEAGTRH
jgi:tight adherence protein C